MCRYVRKTTPPFKTVCVRCRPEMLPFQTLGVSAGFASRLPVLVAALKIKRVHDLKNFLILHSTKKVFLFDTLNLWIKYFLKCTKIKKVISTILMEMCPNYLYFELNCVQSAK